MSYKVIVSQAFATRFDAAVDYRRTHLGRSSVAKLVTSFREQVERLSLFPTMGTKLNIKLQGHKSLRWAQLESYILIYRIVSEDETVVFEDLFFEKENWQDKLQFGSKDKPMKTYKVVAAIIRREDKVLATQRGYGEYKDWWEFPGGKIEPGETPEAAIKREIHEELAADIEVERPVVDVSYDYPDFHLDMRCFLCELESGVTLLEHEDAKWLDRGDIDSVNWLPADEQVVAAIREQEII